MSRLLFPIAILAFVSLGLPDGVLGVAWPSIRHTFGLALSQLGVLLTAATAGYLIASFGSGTLVLRLGVGRLLVASSVLLVVSLGIFALAPVWPAIVLAGFLSGLGGGAIDAGINGFAASSFSPRRTAWLHASYGAGAAIGPLVMTGVLTVGASWRLGYAAVTAVLIGMTAAFALTVNAWPGVRSGAMSALDRGLTITLRQTPVIAHLVLFFLYTGLEATAGQWTYSLFTERRDVSPAMAGTWSAVYWGSLTGGRIAVPAVLRRASIAQVLRATTALAPVAALLIWIGSGPTAWALGVALLGLALAPIYPLLISATPGRVGAEHATHAIGAQVAAAYLGGAAIPSIAGVMARTAGLETIGPVLTVAAIAVFLVHEWLLRHEVRVQDG